MSSSRWHQYVSPCNLQSCNLQSCNPAIPNLQSYNPSILQSLILSSCNPATQIIITNSRSLCPQWHWANAIYHLNHNHRLCPPSTKQELTSPGMKVRFDQLLNFSSLTPNTTETGPTQRSCRNGSRDTPRISSPQPSLQRNRIQPWYLILSNNINLKSNKPSTGTGYNLGIRFHGTIST